MIQLINISKRFGRLPVLNSVNLSLKKGSCVALIGPNGCGKTTLIKAILGMVIADKGQILFDGESIEKQFSYRGRIGYMPQIGRYPDNMTVGQIIKMVTNIRNTNKQTDSYLMDQFNLQIMQDKQMRTLSGGTTQKVSAMLAFLFNPDVLILDEPTAGLDPLSSEILKEKIIAEKAKGKLIIITSHLLNELDDLVTELVYMHEGSITFHKSIADLRTATGEQKISKAISGMMREGVL
jgi:Cu-processing system ATP-binding protein